MKRCWNRLVCWREFAFEFEWSRSSAISKPVRKKGQQLHPVSTEFSSFQFRELLNQAQFALANATIRNPLAGE